MEHTVYYRYLSVEGAELFTSVCLPAREGRYPAVLFRSPYVDDKQDLCEDEICENLLVSKKAWLDRGYVVVSQHCRGRGKSTGDCVPYIYEREDGLALQNWVRQQSFYNGEIYLVGGSYTATVHFATAPFAPDIKGAVLEVQDTERYHILYRNGQFKIGIHGQWYVEDMYHKKDRKRWNYVPESFHMLPLSRFTETVFGQPAADFDEALKHPDPNDAFWQTRFGGAETRNALRNANIPILLVTGYFDIYCGGVLDMWNALDDCTRAQSALLVHPYDHGGSGKTVPYLFENGNKRDAFPEYQRNWLEYIRGRGAAPLQPGKVTYYSMFENRWCQDDTLGSEETICLPIGDTTVTYRYNPYAPATFRGGLSTNFGGTDWQDLPNSRYDIVSFYTPEFSRDTTVKGAMSATLRVRSNCEDTCFYLRVSITKPEGDLGLRDDIQQLSNFYPDYVPGQEVELPFTFDPIALRIRKGERLRIDISSSAFPHYVRHTNQRGLFSEQTTVRIADNTVHCERSFLTIPIETEKNEV